jgi:catechol 2,3-dioxygenase-like lactoylglutathione lyase family enzyme
MQITKIGHINLWVRDRERSKAFYEDWPASVLPALRAAARAESTV